MQYVVLIFHVLMLEVPVTMTEYQTTPKLGGLNLTFTGLTSLPFARGWGDQRVSALRCSVSWGGSSGGSLPPVSGGDGCQLRPRPGLSPKTPRCGLSMWPGPPCNVVAGSTGEFPKKENLRRAVLPCDSAPGVSFLLHSTLMQSKALPSFKDINSIFGWKVPRF